jgi:hypothetical protein
MAKELVRVYVRYQWFTLVILATQKAETRRIMARSQSEQIVQETPSQNKPITKKGVGPEFKPQYHKKKKIMAIMASCIKSWLPADGLLESCWLQRALT